MYVIVNREVRVGDMLRHEGETDTTLFRVTAKDSSGYFLAIIVRSGRHGDIGDLCYISPSSIGLHFFPVEFVGNIIRKVLNEEV